MTLAAIGILAGLWVGAHLAMWLVSPWLMPREGGAYTNGLFIHVPASTKAALTEHEVAALRAHEWGHIRYGHPYLNLLRAIFALRLKGASADVLAKRQEMQADDYAISRGHGPALASALHKLGTGPFDLFRADRISGAL